MNQIEKVYPKLFTWLAVGLFITFITGYTMSLFMETLFPILLKSYLVIAIIEIILAIVLSMKIQDLSPPVVKVLYIIYTLFSGLTFGAIFIVYELPSIMLIFALTTVIFIVLAAFGYFTKIDISKFGWILFCALIASILFSIINAIFIKSSGLDLAITIIGCLIFAGYIAYDIHKIKGMLEVLGEEKAAVYGAFQLYLDFINLFIRLLDLLGKKKD